MYKFTSILCGLLFLMSTSASAEETVLFHDAFNNDNGDIPQEYWREGDSRASIKNGRLLLDAYNDGRGGQGTVWLDKEFQGNLHIEFDAHVVASIGKANNINFFLLFSDPSGEAIRSSRDERSDGVYGRYGCAESKAATLCSNRTLNGYILTFLANGSEDQARFRLRGAPGFHLLSENYAYENRQGKTYRVGVLKEGNTIQYLVDGSVWLSYADKGFNSSHQSGIMGFRTWNTKVWFDNFKIVKLP